MRKEPPYDPTGKDATSVANIKNVDLKIEAVVIPVSDVDRAKKFYGYLGWRLDADFAFDNGFRVVQFTTPGPVQFGTNITPAAHGAQFQPDGTSGRVKGPSPDHATYRSFATFSDADGNGWLLQEIGQRDANWPDWYAAYMVAEPS